MDPSVIKLFDANAREYDRQRRQLIPCFDDFYGMALSLVESGHQPPQILDLGAGTGLFSSMVLLKYPEARLTLMDMSDKMLEEARQRFKDADNVQYISGDYSSYPFTQTYDIVISSLSIHHLAHADKKKLFKTIHQLLNEGGIFINADQVKGHTDQADVYYRQRWLESIRASGLSEEAINASIERRKLDINATAADQMKWMDQAGLTDVDCMYKYLDFAVFYGKKSGRSS